MSRKDQNTLAEQGIEFQVKPLTVVDDAVSIDPIVSTDLGRIAAEEKFMNERLVVRIATTTDPNAPPFATLTVNDVNNRVQVHRGVPTELKRCHVEVLARMRETRYVQPPRNMMDPETGNAILARHAQVYPFEVLKDDNPKGRAWLDHIMAEAA